MKKFQLRGISTDLIETLIHEQVNNKKFLQDEEKMKELKTVLTQKGYNTTEITWNSDRNVYDLYVIPDENNLDLDQQALKIGKGLVYSKEYQNLMNLNKKMSSYLKAPYEVSFMEKDSEPVVIEEAEKLFFYIIEEGKKGLGVQRYKGLGEMNPDQLWETTMDPEKRMLLKVKVEDALDADEIFTVLMGEEVEPRREFIQNNALEVSTLDI